MIDIVSPTIERYIRQLYADDDVVRTDMERLARQRRFPIVGPLVGRQLSQLTHMVRARRVFELGSGYGYSALFFARAVGSRGVVHCTDLSRENIRLARAFLTRAGVWSRVTYHKGEAIETFAALKGTWDIIFNDIDKPHYPVTIDLAYSRLRRGGLFISDNVLWSGRVAGSARHATPSTRALMEFNRRLLAHPGFLTRIDPTRDGLAIALRL